MANPFVVFLAGNRDVKGWRCPVDLPVGWKADGSRGDPTKEACDYLLLVLDDSLKVGPLVHTNVDATQPLLVLKHENSSANKQPESDEGLLAFGRPRVLASFSHHLHNHTFNRIRRLIAGELAAEEFVSAFHSETEASALVDLAAICQLALLSPSLPSSSEWMKEIEPRKDAALAEIPEAIADKFESDLVDKGKPMWRERLELIAARASELQAQ